MFFFFCLFGTMIINMINVYIASLCGYMFFCFVDFLSRAFFKKKKKQVNHVDR